MASYYLYDSNSVDRAKKAYDNVAYSAPKYTDSQETQKARSNADYYARRYQQSVNDGYKGTYTDTINQLADKYTNNEFNWNLNESSEYHSLKDKYEREGAKQQENVQGNYASNTGGYSNSYAQSAGQKAYSQYMDELQEKIPTLKQNAYTSWSQEQENTLNKISVMQGLDDTEYQKYRDQVQDNYDFMTYYENKYSSSKGLDMSEFQNELSKWQSQLSAASSNLSDIRQLSQQQFEHNSVSADTQASINSSKAQSDAYYNYLYSQMK